jgi:replicative DNA helicase
MSDVFTQQEEQSYAPQIVPHSRDAEEAVVGSVLINPDAYFDVAPFLQAEDFYIHRHRLGGVYAIK